MSSTPPTARLQLDDQSFEFPVIVGSENEPAFDVSSLRKQTGYITLDDGYSNTGSCQSNITFIDGEKGILRYRGYSIEELAEKSGFIESAYLIIYGHLPTRDELRNFSQLLTDHQLLHEDMKYHLEGFPTYGHPMAILSSMINAAGCFHPGLLAPFHIDSFRRQSARLLSQVRTIAAFSYRKSRGMPIIYPKPEYKYAANFLHMMFSQPYADIELDPRVVRALDLVFLLHADHEQNCSTATVRMVASSRANLYASAAAGVCALWGPLHGGANQAVVEMLQAIHDSGDDGSRFIEDAKNPETKKRLMGFGHRVYKNYDPRAAIIKKHCDEVLKALKIEDPLLDIAKRMEEKALNDSYFVERKLYPNVDFYSGIIFRAIGIPLQMFPVMFAIGRMPGWIANFKEVAENPQNRIYRPRQIYMGAPLRHYVPIQERTAGLRPARATALDPSTGAPAP